MGAVPASGTNVHTIIYTRVSMTALDNNPGQAAHIVGTTTEKAVSLDAIQTMWTSIAWWYNYVFIYSMDTEQLYVRSQPEPHLLELLFLKSLL